MLVLYADQGIKVKQPYYIDQEELGLGSQRGGHQVQSPRESPWRATAVDANMQGKYITFTTFAPTEH